MLAFDTETRSFRWWERDAFLGSWSTGRESGTEALPAGGGSGEQLAARLEAATEIDTANGKFDAHEAREAIGVDIFELLPPEKINDVLMMSRLLYGARRNSHGLKELAVDFIDPKAAGAEKDMQEKYRALTGRSNMEHDDAFYVTWRAHPGTVEKYAELDAVYTHKLRKLFLPQIEADAKLQSLYRLEQQTSRVLYEAEQRGVHVDPGAVERLTKHYQERDAAARRALESTLGFVPEGEGSEDALREGLLRAGVPLTEVTEKTGELAVNRRALGKFTEHPAVAALFEFRRVNKFLQTYILPLTGVEHIHPTFNQAQAWTGRMSGSNPNMQNLPKRTETTVEENLRVRSVFVPSPGMEFIIADYDSIEMRLLAYDLADPVYRRMIDEGDPHAMTAAAAAQTLGLESNRMEDYLKSTPNRWFRDIAKQGTYSIVYGGGGPVVMDTINKMVVDAGHPEYRVTLEQARAIRRQITGAIPGFDAFTASPWGGPLCERWCKKGRLYQQLENSAVTLGGRRLAPEEIRAAVEDGEKVYGYVRTLLGRKQWIPLEKAYVALSGRIQGSAADVMKAAAVNLREALRPYGGYPVMFVHDEAVVEVPAGWGERLIPVVVEAMEQAAETDPPLRVEATWTARSYAHHD